MSKLITRSIAALGVIAGLSVAALPLTSYATTDESDITVSATVGAATFAIGNTGSIGMTQAAAGTTMGEGATNINVTSNAPGGYTLAMGIPSTATSADLIHTTSPTNVISAGTATAATTAWSYGFASGLDQTVGSFVTPVQYADTAFTGGTTITAGTTGNSAWTIAAQYGLAAGNALASGNYVNNIVIYGAEI